MKVSSRRCDLSSVQWRLRDVGIGALALVVPCLSLFAAVASRRAMPTFSPVPIGVPTEAIVLLGLTATTFASVGALVSMRTRGNVIGWLLMAIGWSMALTLASIAAVALDLNGARWAEWASQWVAIPHVLLAYVLLLFPDGRLPSPRWRYALWLDHVTLFSFLVSGLFAPYVRDGAYMFDNPVGLGAVRGSVFENAAAGWYLMPLAILAGASAFVVRYRGSSGVARAQLKWFGVASGVVAVGYLFLNVTWVISWSGTIDIKAFGLVVMILCFNAVPIASGFAILRYRLYDIDHVVSRTVTYLGVTGVVVGVYLTVVVTATALLSTHSSLIVAGATLAAAAVVEPTRRRIQTQVDRRFNRARYDAANTALAFSSRLRDAVDPDGVRDDLVGTVGSTLQPDSIALWIRERT